MKFLFYFLIKLLFSQLFYILFSLGFPHPRKFSIFIQLNHQFVFWYVFVVILSFSFTVL
ncbi:hypothetical protein CLU79DRAFT_773260 [Phycomyces nitens]|nr:hypothetical protein CLU79DRAFT_773260 [Phycomyces nitens]